MQNPMPLHPLVAEISLDEKVMVQSTDRRTLPSPERGTRLKKKKKHQPSCHYAAGWREIHSSHRSTSSIITLQADVTFNPNHGLTIQHVRYKCMSQRGPEESWEYKTPGPQQTTLTVLSLHWIWLYISMQNMQPVTMETDMCRTHWQDIVESHLYGCWPKLK